MVNLITDIWNPAKGSEFIVFNKLIECIDKSKSYRVFTMLRADNKSSIDAYLDSVGLIENVEVCYYPMRYADEGGNHKSKFQFFYECYRFYCWTNKRLDGESILRFGQPHWSFNLLCLITIKSVTIGIISGLSRISGFSLYHMKSNLVVFLGRLSYFILSQFRKPEINGATQSDVNFLLSLGINSTRVSEIPRLKLEQKLVKDPRLLIWSGALIYRKNLTELLSVWKETSTNMKLQIFGNGSHKSKYRESDFSNVFWLGSVPRADYLKKLKRGSVYITTSYQEVNSLAYYEALASGCIIFARIAGGLADFSLPGVYFYTHSNELKELLIDYNLRGNRFDFDQKSRIEMLNSVWDLEERVIKKLV